MVDEEINDPLFNQWKEGFEAGKMAGQEIGKVVEKEIPTENFLTGSRAYGNPRINSDIDVVVMFSHNDLLKIMEVSGQKFNESYGNTNSASLKFGKLNLICVADHKEFLAWKEGTEELIARKPVTKQQAIECLDQKLGLPKREPNKYGFVKSHAGAFNPAEQLESDFTGRYEPNTPEPLVPLSHDGFIEALRAM